MQPNIIPNNTNITNIINETLKITPEITKSIDSVVKIITKLTDNIEYKSLIGATSKLKKVHSMVAEYMCITKDIISALVVPQNDSNYKHLFQLCGYIEKNTGEKVVNGKKEKIVEAQYRNIDAIFKISSVMNGLLSGMSEMMKIDVGLKLYKNFRINLKLIKKYIGGAVSDLIKTLGDIANDSNISKIIDSLVSDPEVINEILEDRENWDKAADEKSSYDKGDKSSYKIIETTKGKQGLLDVIKGAFDILKLMLEIQVPSYIVMKKKMKRVKMSYILAFNSIKEIAELVKDNATFKNLQMFGKMLRGTGKNGDDGLLGSITNLYQVVNTLGEIGRIGLVIRLSLLNKAILPTFINILKNISGIFNNDNQKIIDGLVSANTQKKIEKINEVINSIELIITDLLKTTSKLTIIGAVSIALISLSPLIRLSIECIKWFIGGLVSISVITNNIDFKTLDEKLSEISLVIISLNKIALYSISLGILALPATLAMKLSGIFIKSFDAFITLLNNSFKNNDIDHVEVAINNIKSILKSLLIVSIELIAFGVIAMKATKYLLIGSVYILGLFGFVLLVVNLMNTIRLAKVRKMQMITNMIVNIFKNLLLITAEIIIFALASPALIVACAVSLIAITAFVGLMWLISGVMGLLSKLSIKMTINTTVVGLTIAFVVGVLIASALALLALAKISEVVVPALLNIGILLGGIVVLIVALIGLGALLLAATPIIIPAMIGLGLAMILIGELLLTALMLKGLSDIDIQKDVMSNKIDDIKDVISIIRDGMVELALDNKFMLQSTIGMRRTKRLTKQIRKIAENLNAIQSITLDKAAIDNNITKIFGVVGDIERRLLEFNRVKPLDENGNDTESIIDKIKNARQQKRLLKQNTKVMRRTDRIVGEIYDITEKLNFIQGIEIQEGKINDSVTKIFGIINNLETELSKFNTGVEVANSSSIDMISEIEKSKGKRKYFRQNKRTLNKVDKILGEVYDIAQKLEYLKTIEIKPDDVIVSVDKVFEVVTSVENQLNTEMVVGRKDVKVFKNKLNIVNEINNFIEQFTIPTFKTIDSTPYSKFIESVNGILDAVDGSRIKKRDINNFRKKIEIVNEINNFIEQFTIPTLKTIDSTPYSEFIKSVNGILEQIDNQKVREKGIERFNKNIGIIKNITIDINSIDKLTNDIDKKTYINIIDDIDLILSRISGSQQIKYDEFNKKLGAVKKAGKILTEFSHDFLSINTNDVDKVTENYIKFVDKINNSKLENLKTTANIFEKMARFSETINGNFEGLATTINDKLMPLLEELKETMNSVPDKLDKGFAGTQNSIYEASPNTSRNVSSFNNQVKAEAIAMGKNVSEEEINRKAQNMMNQQMSNMSHGIEAKLDELIEILSGSLKVQME